MRQNESSVHQASGTSTEVNRRTFLWRSIAVVAPALLVLGLVGWQVVDRIASPVPVAVGDLSSPTVADEVLGAATVPGAQPDATSATRPAPSVEPTVIPPAPVLTGTQLVTAGAPVAVRIDSPAGLRLAARPANGLAQIEPDGRVTYLPNETFVGVDSFTVESCNEGGCGQAQVDVEVLPSSVSAYVNAPVDRLLDTRSGEVLAPNSVVAATLAPAAEYEAVALSVTLMGSQSAGGVEVDAGSGPVAALAVPGPGATTTNLVIVPTNTSSSLSVTTTAGGHLIIDQVGYFASTTESAPGRFVQLSPIRAAHLVTAIDGREATVNTGEFSGVLHAEVGAVLALITADVGSDGGRVQLGPGVADYDQMLMWGAPTGPNLQRRGVVLITPDAAGNFSFRYEGGSEIDVDVLGYFTSQAAPIEQAGLFVPSQPSQVVQGDFLVGDNVVGDLPDYAAAAFVTLTAEPGVTGSQDARDLGIASGRTIATALTVGPTPDGSGQGVVVPSTSELEAQLQILGVFLAE